MRKPNVSALLLITIVFAAFTLGFFLGNHQNGDGITVSVSEECLTVPAVQTDALPEATEETVAISFPISINRAGKEEFMALPGIGEVLAERIVAYRDEHGQFTFLEELLNVEGIGKKRLEEILNYIAIGG